MQHDLETLYTSSLPDFIRVSSEGFGIAGHQKSLLEVSIQDEQVARKLWDHGKVLCQSINGHSSLTTAKACRVCSDQRRCRPQIILYVLADETPFRIALNHTSAQNYLTYRRRLLDDDHDLNTIITALSVVSHDTWGEVQFQHIF